jgi:hypothetical protein
MTHPKFTVEGFWARVDRSAGEEGCWLWTGGLNHHGYGTIKIHGKTTRAHRLAWELTYSPIPEGMCVCHHCDNPSCVRPDHLFLGTQMDNIQDRHTKGRGSGGVLLGPDHPQCRVSDDDVRVIRRLFHQDHVAAKDIAARFAIQPGHVWDIAAGRKRKMVH